MLSLFVYSGRGDRPNAQRPAAITQFGIEHAGRSTSINHQLSTMNFHLRVWRQPNRESRGKLVDYEAKDVSPNASFLEMLDLVNERLLFKGEIPIAFDS